MSLKQYDCIDSNPFLPVLQDSTRKYIENTAQSAMGSRVCCGSPPMDSIPEDERQRAKGRERLADIVRSARESRKLSLRPFAELVGVSHGTIQRVEQASSETSDEVLAAIAEVTPYTYVELKVISLGIELEDIRTYVTAEDVMAVAEKIERSERLRLIHLLLDYQQEH